MTGRIRRFPVGEEFRTELPTQAFGPGDTLELERSEEATDEKSPFFEARIVRKDGSSLGISLETAVMLFRNGMLG